MRSVARSRRRWPVAAAGLLLAGGCASAPTAEVVDAPPVAPPRRAAEVRPGLVVERLRVREASAELDAAIVAIPEVGPAPEIAERWRREGLLVKVVDEDGLAALEATLGSAILPSRTWHGEATGWRSAARRRLARGAVILQDGRARPVDDTILALAVRGWSMPLVDGGALQVEIVPHLTATTIDPLAAPVPPGELRGDPLAPMIEHTLGPDRILLVATVPDRRRSASTTESEASDATDAASASETSPATEPAAEPAADPPRALGAGPVAALPPTIGGWLVDDPISGERGVLLIRGRPHPAVGLPGTSNPDPGVAVVAP